MNDKIKELIDKIKTANNILVSVDHNPSIDELAGCIGLTLFVNKLNKHGSGVFSGQVPSVIDFLKPDTTLEKNTDSLRDFIISLDKNKADKLKYKPDGDKVKIFITPYKTSINQNDLEFSQGDFNVDLVIVLGAINKKDLDQAVTVNDRILHDAIVATININQKSEMGLLNILEPNSSSLCETIALMCVETDKNLLDEQISTAFLTGIVAETDRFSNSKTTANTLSVSATLLSTGANQQLVADQLSNFSNLNQVQKPEEDLKQNKSTDDNTLMIKNDDGNLLINHDDEPEVKTQPEDSQNDLKHSPVNPFLEADNLGQTSSTVNDTKTRSTSSLIDDNSEVDQSSPISANLKPEDLDPSIDPLSGISPVTENPVGFSLPQPVDNLSDTPNLENDLSALNSDNSLNDSSINTDTVNNTDSANQSENQTSAETDKSSISSVDQARQAVQSALQNSDPPMKPIVSLNALPLAEVNHTERLETEEEHEFSSEILVNENGDIDAQHNHPAKQDDPNINNNMGHELKIEPLHNLEPNLNFKTTDTSQLNSPPPVPPPIPMNFGQ